MKSISIRIAELEKRAAEVVASSGDTDRLLKELETIASRLEWGGVTSGWAEKQPTITIIAVVLHGPLPAIEAVFPRFLEISERNDAAGQMARNLLEMAQ